MRVQATNKEIVIKIVNARSGSLISKRAGYSALISELNAPS